MKDVPKPLNHKPLRRLIKEALNNYGDDGWKFREHEHVAEKHPNLGIGDLLLAFIDDWRETTHQYDRKHRTWRYTIRTLGLNDRWQNTCFTIDAKKKEIFIVTKYQEEKGNDYQAQLRRPLHRNKSDR